MSLVNYSFTALKDSDPTINAVPAQDVEVRVELDDSLAVIYSDSAGASPITQPGAVTDSNGVLEFWVEAGIYKIESAARIETVIIDNGTRNTFDTVAEMTASKHLRVGDKGTTKEFSTGNGGGADYNTVLTSSVTPLPTGSTQGANVIVSTANALISFVLIVTSPVNTREFGAKAIGAAFDDQPACQAAEDFAAAATQSGTFVGLGDKTVMKVFYPKGVYNFETLPVSLGSYLNYKGDDAIIICGASHFAFDGSIANSFFRFQMKGFSFQDNNALDISNNNQDTGKILVEQCKFLGCITAVEYECQSTNGLFKDCTWFKCATEINVIKGDYVVIDGGWIKQKDRTANQQAGIENAGKLILKNVLGVPGATGGFSETAWINNRATAGGHRTGVVIIDRFRAGGENGSKTLVNNFAPANNDSDIRPTVVSITNSDAYTVDGALTTGRGVVRLFDTPNLLAMKRNTGFNQTVALVAGSGVNLTTLMAGKEDIIKVELDNFKSDPFSFAEDPANNMLPELFGVQSVSKQIIQTTFAEVANPSVSGWSYISKFATTANLTLPPAKTGMEFTGIRSDTVGGGFHYEMIPDGTETIRGGTAGQKLRISSDWTGVTLHCYDDGFWEVKAVINNAFGTGYTFV